MSCASFVCSCDCGVLIFTNGWRTIACAHATYLNASRSPTSSEPHALPYHAIRRASKGFTRRTGLTPPCDVLLVLDSPRGPLEFQGKNLQQPTHGHRGWRVANRLVTGLILQLSRNGNCPLRGSQGAHGICRLGGGYGKILRDAELSLENRDIFPNGCQVQHFCAGVSHRLQFDSWGIQQGELNRLVTLDPRSVDVYIR